MTLGVLRFFLKFTEENFVIRFLVVKELNQNPSLHLICNVYTTVCPPVGGGNPQVLTSGLSPVQVDKPWYKYFIPPSLIWTIAQYDISC